MLLTSCVSAPYKQFQQDLEAKRCDAAMAHVPENDPAIKFAGNTKQTFGTVAAYTFVGFSYTAEVLWDVTGGTVMAVALCGIPSTLSVAATYQRGQSAGILTCFPGKLDALGAPPLGRRALAATEELRCPDLTSLSRSLRSVASCYSGEKTEVGRTKAKQVLTSLQNSEDFYSCLSESERHAIGVQIRDLDDPISSYKNEK